MDKLLIAKVKSLLAKCTESNYDLIRNKVMAALKPKEADIVYYYFCSTEKDFIEDNYKLHPDQVLPRTADYYISDNSSDVYSENDD